MKKKAKPTTSQYSYMVTGLLAAKVQRNGVVIRGDVIEAVATAKMAYELIAEVIGDIDDDEEDKPSEKKVKEPMPNYFDNYIWEDGVATWSELANWLKKQGVTSNRRISNIFRESLEKGFDRGPKNLGTLFPEEHLSGGVCESGQGLEKLGKEIKKLWISIRLTGWDSRKIIEYGKFSSNSRTPECRKVHSVQSIDQDPPSYR